MAAQPFKVLCGDDTLVIRYSCGTVDGVLIEAPDDESFLGAAAGGEAYLSPLFHLLHGFQLVGEIYAAAFEVGIRGEAVKVAVEYLYSVIKALQLYGDVLFLAADDRLLIDYHRGFLCEAFHLPVFSDTVKHILREQVIIDKDRKLAHICLVK